jgi:hypothetical protein
MHGNDSYLSARGSFVDSANLCVVIAGAPFYFARGDRLFSLALVSINQTREREEGSG